MIDKLLLKYWQLRLYHYVCWNKAGAEKFMVAYRKHPETVGRKEWEIYRSGFETAREIKKLIKLVGRDNVLSVLKEIESKKNENH